MSATQNGQQTSSEQQEMPLIEHLLELRNRLLKMVLAVKQLSRVETTM